MNKAAHTVLLTALLSGCAVLKEGYTIPREDGDGRIDHEQLSDDIDIKINKYCKIDTEEAELLCACNVLDIFCTRA